MLGAKGSQEADAGSGPQGLRVQPKALATLTSQPGSTIACWVTLPGLLPSLGLASPLSHETVWLRSEAPWGKPEP